MYVCMYVGLGDIARIRINYTSAQYVYMYDKPSS